MVRAVGTTNYVFESFAVDQIPARSPMRQTYEAENAQRFRHFGVAGTRNTPWFGLESPSPTVGYGLNYVSPYLTAAATCLGRPAAGLAVVTEVVELAEGITAAVSHVPRGRPDEESP